LRDTYRADNQEQIIFPVLMAIDPHTKHVYTTNLL